MAKPGFTIAALWLAWAVASASLAQSSAQVSSPLARESVIAAAQRLKPGEFLWAPQTAPEGPVLIIISRVTQRAVVYRNGVPIGITTVSTGRPGYSTPTGVFTILQKRKEHYSNLYNNAPMPFMQRLTWGGVALHAGELPGHPASHGCIRLPYGFAQKLFEVTSLGGTVVITDEAALPRLALNGPGMEPERTARDASGFTWTPSQSPEGPVSVVMSTTDRRMVVLRNGVEIGSSPFSLVRKAAGTALYTLTSDQRWLRVPLPGQEAPPEAEALEDRHRFTAPDGFLKALAETVRPGTTVVVTSDSLKRNTEPQADLLISDPHP